MSELISESELGFLLDLFLCEEVPTTIKQKIKDRIRNVEKAMVTNNSLRVCGPIDVRGHYETSPRLSSLPQAPSMQRIIEAHPDIPIPVATPTTPAAAAALQNRANIIMKGMKEKPEEGRTSPRKI